MCKIITIRCVKSVKNIIYMYIILTIEFIYYIVPICRHFYKNWVVSSEQTVLMKELINDKFWL